MEYEVLPRKYWERHDYLLYAYDVLKDMVQQAEKKNLLYFSLNFKSEEQCQSFEIAEDMFEWMDKNGKHDVSLKMFHNDVFFSLLTDFCFFLYESLSCASRGKVTVAYSLLRKPMRDNLLYIEWLLADPEEFYQAFMNGGIKDYDVSNFNLFSKERIQKIIKTASNKTYMGKSINSNNLVYTLRFNHKENIGLQRRWNQSMHLVTTSNHYRTAQGNINFIFSDKETWNDNWNYYYLAMPQLMAYVLEVCEAIFLNIITPNSFEVMLNRTIRYAKYDRIQPKSLDMKGLIKLPYKLIKIVQENQYYPSFVCENCKKNIPIKEQTITEMINSWDIVCPHCKQEHSICKYYTDLYYTK